MIHNETTRLSSAAATSEAIAVPHYVKGATQTNVNLVHKSRDLEAGFTTPELDLDELVWLRTSPGPAFETPLAEIFDFLEELGKRLDLDSNSYLQEALEQSIKVNPLGPRILENCYRDMAGMFDRQVMEDEVDLGLGGRDVIDGWQQRSIRGRTTRLRAFPSRMVHILAGNSPMVTAMTIMRGAITKGVHLLKLPSNDLFTATAILRTMAKMDATHPVTRSFSAVYWRGGDTEVESAIYRPQYFDKIVVWGGESAVRHVAKYAGPGLELIAFDPKVSFSLIGREIFEAESTLREAAQRGAADVLSFNQDACNASRFQFIEADEDQADLYCQALSEALTRDVRYGAGHGPQTPADIRNEVETLRELEPVYRVFGDYEGGGLVVRSDEMVDFHPTCKTVNVVCVDSLAQAAGYANVATQTVGVFPSTRVAEVRDTLARVGVQRIVTLGEVNSDGVGGYPHDAMIPVHRFMKWISEEAQ